MSFLFAPRFSVFEDEFDSFYGGFERPCRYAPYYLCSTGQPTSAAVPRRVKAKVAAAASAAAQPSENRAGANNEQSMDVVPAATETAVAPANPAVAKKTENFLTKFDPFGDLAVGWPSTSSLTLRDSGDRYEWTMPRANFADNEMNVESKDGYLTVSGEKKQENTEQTDAHGNKFSSKSYSSFSRSVKIPADVEQQQISAHTTEDGALVISLPKVAPSTVKSNVKQIAISKVKPSDVSAATSA
jgi:HSP20 family molecular chaperone IbpA